MDLMKLIEIAAGRWMPLLSSAQRKEHYSYWYGKERPHQGPGLTLLISDRNGVNVDNFILTLADLKNLCHKNDL
jgi:hypothetical protein